MPRLSRPKSGPFTLLPAELRSGRSRPRPRWPRGAALLTPLVLIGLAGCKPKEPELSSSARGERAFAPAARELGEEIARGLKKDQPADYERYLKETGSSTPAELGARIGGEILSHYAASLALSPQQESQFQAGKFDDAGNAKMLDHLTSKYEDVNRLIPQSARWALRRVRTGVWKAGLGLEFTLRILLVHLAPPAATLH
jgi:hypothetical protein